MIYIVTLFNGQEWIDFIAFTVEEYATKFMNKMKNAYPDLKLTINAKYPNEYERAFAFSVDIADETTFTGE